MHDSERTIETDVREDIIDGINDAGDEAVLTDETPLEYTESECTCVLCNNFNTMKERWANWEPKDDIYKIFKIHIENMNYL